MSTQIFKNSIPNDKLFDLLDKICLKNEKHYTFNIESFKKGSYSQDIQNFISLCKKRVTSENLKDLSIKVITILGFITFNKLII